MMAPWDEYANKVRALFGPDPDVAVGGVEGYGLTIRVHGDDKAESIRAILPAEVTFGNVTLAIEVVPDNEAEPTVADHLRRAFAGNPYFMDVLEVPVTAQAFGATYALFMPEAVQYYNDSLQSPYGARTCAVEEIAREVLALPDGVLVSSAEM